MTTVSDYDNTLGDEQAAGDTACPGPFPALPPDLAHLTPDRAQQLARILAPHHISMRAVIAGTRYAAAAGAGPDRAISPATKIFIAGVLAGDDALGA